MFSFLRSPVRASTTTNSKVGGDTQSDSDAANIVPTDPSINRIKLYNGETDGIYEIECEDGTGHGLVFDSSRDGNYTVVTDFQRNDRNAHILLTAKKNDVLVTINGRSILEDDPSDIKDLLDMIQSTKFLLRIKLLNTSKVSITEYVEMTLRRSLTFKDIYGFKQTAKYVNAEKRQLHSDTQKAHARDIDWVEFLKSIGGPDNLKPAGVYRPSADLRYICRRGISPAMRPMIWPRISLSALSSLEYPPDHYQTLLGLLVAVPQKVKDDIEKDLDRTFPLHDYFERGDGCDSMRRVLLAFALHNPDIGYCQSLNFVVGTMLLFLTEEESFWLLSTIVDTFLPRQYYTRSMVGCNTDMEVLVRLVAAKLPKLHKHLELHQVQLPLVAVQWFLCIFVNTLAPEVALRVWDIFLNEGDHVLFTISLALLQLCESHILAATDSGEVFNRLKDVGKSIMDPDILINKAFNTTGSVIKSYYYLQKRAYRNPKVQPTHIPDNLVGLGYAHLGPKSSTTSSSLVYRDNLSLNAKSNLDGDTADEMVGSTDIIGNYEIQDHNQSSSSTRYIKEKIHHRERDCGQHNLNLGVNLNETDFINSPDNEFDSSFSIIGNSKCITNTMNDEFEECEPQDEELEVFQASFQDSPNQNHSITSTETDWGAHISDLFEHTSNLSSGTKIKFIQRPRSTPHSSKVDLKLESAIKADGGTESTPNGKKLISSRSAPASRTPTPNLDRNHPRAVEKPSAALDGHTTPQSLLRHGNHVSSSEKLQSFNKSSSLSKQKSWNIRSLLRSQSSTQSDIETLRREIFPIIERRFLETDEDREYFNHSGKIMSPCINIESLQNWSHFDVIASIDNTASNS